MKKLSLCALAIFLAVYTSTVFARENSLELRAFDGIDQSAFFLGRQDGSNREGLANG